MTVHRMNSTTLGLSEYDTNAVALVEHNGSTFVVMADGLHELTGSDDNGTAIAAYVETGRLDLGSRDRRKRCVEVRVDGKLGHGVEVTTTTVENGSDVERVYVSKGSNGTERMSRRVKTGKGVRSVFWKYKLANVNGGAFDIDGFSIIPVLERPVQ